MGIGTNEAAILSGVNKAGCHMDGIILKPTLYLDGEKVIDKGEFLVEG